MECVALSRKLAAEIRIALPIDEIGTLHRAVATGRKPSMRQSIGQYVPHGVFQFAATRKVAALVNGIAPASVLRPMPCGHAKFSVVAIGDRSPSCRERLLHNVRRVDLVDSGMRQDVNRAAQRPIRVEGIQHMTRVRIHSNDCAGVRLAGLPRRTVHRAEREPDHRANENDGGKWSTKWRSGSLAQFVVRFREFTWVAGHAT